MSFAASEVGCDDDCQLVPLRGTPYVFVPQRRRRVSNAHPDGTIESASGYGYVISSIRIHRGETWCPRILEFVIRQICFR